MTPSIGVNLRVTGHCNQGGRKYMEDAFAVAYQQTADQKDLEFAYFGIFDGHGGRSAALFAKEHLMEHIVSLKHFWSDSDESILKAIKDGFISCHMAMWKELGNWPRTMSGLPSTSGTTASIVFIRRGKMYVGHVGDSAIVLGYQEPDKDHLSAQPLTRDHKPETPAERKRIENVGGQVMCKSGVQRVVWNRPRLNHNGPVRRSTHIDQIPFLAVARSLGDLWSYDYFHGEFVVSPVPDLNVITIDPKRDRCLILATDGLWNMLNMDEAVDIVERAERENERHILEEEKREPVNWVNPSKLLVERALELWSMRCVRADNTSVVTVMLDPPGPPKSEVLLRQQMLRKLRPRDELASDDPLPYPPSSTAQESQSSLPSLPGRKSPQTIASRTCRTPDPIVEPRPKTPTDYSTPQPSAVAESSSFVPICPPARVPTPPVPPPLAVASPPPDTRAPRKSDPILGRYYSLRGPQQTDTRTGRPTTICHGGLATADQPNIMQEVPANEQQENAVVLTPGLTDQSRRRSLCAGLRRTRSGIENKDIRPSSAIGKKRHRHPAGSSGKTVAFSADVLMASLSPQQHPHPPPPLRTLRSSNSCDLMALTTQSKRRRVSDSGGDSGSESETPSRERSDGEDVTARIIPGERPRRKVLRHRRGGKATASASALPSASSSVDTYEHITRSKMRGCRKV